MKPPSGAPPPPICTRVLCLIRTHCTSSLRVVASLALWTSPSQEEAGNSVAGGCRSHGGGPCQKGLPGEGQAPTVARARGHPVASWEGAPCGRCAGPVAAALQTVPARLEAGARVASGDARRPAEEAQALSAWLLELRHTYEESAASQRTLRRANKNLKGTLPWEPEQGPGRALRQGQGCLDAQKPQHRPGLAWVLTFPF